MQVGIAQDVYAAAAVDGARLDQGVFGLAAIGAAVHAQRAADAAGNAAHECKSGNAGFLRRARYFHIGHCGAGAYIVFFDRNLIEAAAEPDHDAWNAAVAHNQIGAKPDDRNGDIARQIGEKIRQIAFVFGHEQKLRRAADAKPGQLGERLVRQQPAAQIWHAFFEHRHKIGKRHQTAPAAASSPGSA